MRWIRTDPALLTLIVLLVAAGVGGASASLQPFDYAGAWPVGEGERFFVDGIAVAPNGDLVIVTTSGMHDHSSIFIQSGSGRPLSRIEIPVNDTWTASSATDAAVNRSGFIYVTDQLAGPGERGAVLVFSPRGELVDWWQPWAKRDTSLYNGLGIGPDDHVFVTDFTASAVHEFSPGGEALATLGGREGIGPGEFSLPVDVAVGADGTRYVSNFYYGEGAERRGYISRIVPGGAWTGWRFDGEWAHFTCMDERGRLSVSNSVYPPGLAPDPTRRVNADYAVYTYTPDGTLAAVAGSIRENDGEDESPVQIAGTQGESDGQVDFPMGIAVNQAGVLFLTDNRFQTVLSWRPYAAPGGPLTASFAVETQSGVAPFTARFLDYSTGAVSWSWNFGDGRTSNEHAPAHTYLEPGHYTVSLTTADAAGRTATDTHHNAVVATGPAPTPDPGPLVEFRVNQSRGTVPFTVQFTDRSTGAPHAWFWEFGDGGTSLEQNPIHTFTVPGTYRVNLTVFGSWSGPRTGSNVNLRVSPDPRAPVANITLSRSSGTAPLYVRFTDTSTGAPTAWRWDFGGMAWTTMQSPNVVFRRPGEYAVTLTASNSYGSSTVTRNLSVTGSMPRAREGAPVSVVG